MTPSSDSSAVETEGQLSSVRTGIAVGIGFLALYLLAGVLVARWSVADFLSRLSVETALWLLVGSLSVVATFAVPIALHRHYRLVSPLAVLGFVLLGWIVAGVLTGAWFGLSLYVFGLTPVYFVLYVALGGGEYYLRG